MAPYHLNPPTFHLFQVMEDFKHRLTFTHVLSLVFLIFSCSEANLIGEAICKIASCGLGTCNGSADSKPPFFFECDCYPGWSQPKLLDLPIPLPCIVPNCSSVNLTCGVPQIPPFSIPTNLTDSCSFAWCGNGTCAHDEGGGPQCNCAAGAFNLRNSPALPCFQECYLGSDCNDIELGPPASPMTPSPPSGTSGASGPTEAGSSSAGCRKWLGAIGYMAFLMSFQFVIFDILVIS